MNSARKRHYLGAVAGVVVDVTAEDVGNVLRVLYPTVFALVYV
jgi:hypothetical protein